MSAPIDSLVAAAIHDAKNALLVLDTQLAEAMQRPATGASRWVYGSADFFAARATTRRIAAQLTELLTLYRAQGGQLRLAIDDHTLADFVDDLLTELGPLPNHLTLSVDRTMADHLGAWAFDAYLVKLALLDALRNAGRHAQRCVRLVIDQPAAGGIRFVVADDGPGFPAAVLDGDASPSGDASTGLGLVFARLIALRHTTPDGRHGHVELTNAAGAVLSFYLP
jgi:signal transduction histidine kinase